MGTPKGERWGGRQKGTPNTLPDLRAITLKALMKAGGVDYLTRQAELNPMGFMSLLGRVMPRESHVELTAEVRIRQEVRRDLVEKLVILMKAPETTNHDIAHERPALPAITHTPDTMLKAQSLQDREGLSRKAENMRREGASVLTGVVQRAAAMHIENESAGESVSTGLDAGTHVPEVSEAGTQVRENPRDQGIPIRNTGGAVLPKGRPYVGAPTPQRGASRPAE